MCMVLVHMEFIGREASWSDKEKREEEGRGE